MSEKITDLHELFNVPAESLGEAIMANIKGRLETGPYSIEGEFWDEVKDWIVGQQYTPDPWVDIFGMPRSERAGQYISHALTCEHPAAQIAQAMADAQCLMLWEGPGRRHGVGSPLFHIILSAIRGTGWRISATSIILMSADFAACGLAMDGIMDGGFA